MDNRVTIEIIAIETQKLWSNTLKSDRRGAIKYKSLHYSKSNFGDTKNGKEKHFYRCRLLHIFNFTAQLGSRSVDCNIVITDYGIVGIARRSTFTQNDSGFLAFYISCKRYLASFFARLLYKRILLRLY